jgi:hypothetical protein
VLLRHGGDGGIVGRLAEQVDGDDRAGNKLPLGLHSFDGGVERGGVHVVGRRVDVDEHRRCAHERHGLGRGGEGEGGAEDRVARPDLPGHQRQDQGLGARAARQHVSRLAELPEPGLELADLGSHDVGAGPHHLQDGVFQRLAEPGALSLEVDEGNRHPRAIA